MAKKPRENRVPIMMSEEELAAVDDWRFTHRIATRSEAIRRLCQVGLRSARALPTISNDLSECLDLTHDALQVPDEVLRRTVRGVDAKIAHKLFDACNHIFGRQVDTQEKLRSLLVEIAPLTNNPKIDAAIRTANVHSLAESADEAVLESIGESRRAQIERWRNRRAELRAKAIEERKK